MEKRQQAMNVYRTRKYIVTQDIYLNEYFDGSSILFSRDTYYLRNKKFDKQYESNFKEREYINGKRVHTIMYTRKYFG
jgi:hypothetical protein